TACLDEPPRAVLRQPEMSSGRISQTATPFRVRRYAVLYVTVLDFFSSFSLETWTGDIEDTNASTRSAAHHRTSSAGSRSAVLLKPVVRSSGGSGSAALCIRSVQSEKTGSNQLGRSRLSPSDCSGTWVEA